MITKTVSMAVLEHVLCELGYIRHVVPNPHGFPWQALAFTHPGQKEAMVLLPMYQADEQVPLLSLFTTQITLDNADVVDRDTFERMLESAQQAHCINAAPATVMA